MKRLRLLATKASARRDEGVYLLEGPTLVGDALAAGVPVAELFVEADAEAGLVARARAAGIAVVEVAPGGLRGVVDVVSPQPVAAVLPRPVAALAPALAGTDFVLVLVDVGDPGNVGTILRTAEAAGAGAVVCCGTTADPFAPKVVRASAGAVLRLPIVTGVDQAAALAAAGGAGLRRVATTVDAAPAYDALDLCRPVALVFGNEARGLAIGSGGAGQEGIDDLVTIPMAGRSESLNVAMAAAVLSFEVLRQRRTGSGPR